jgi:hypothetical protein
MLPPSHIDMLSNLVLQSNAAINRYLLERQQLHKDLAMLKKHKVRVAIRLTPDRPSVASLKPCPQRQFVTRGSEAFKDTVEVGDVLAHARAGSQETHTGVLGPLA